MQVRGLLIGVVLLAILAGGAWWSQRNEKEKEAKGSTDTPKLVSLKDSDIRQIEIRHRAEPATIIKKDASNRWTMTAPETLRVDQDVASGVASSFAGLTLDRLVEEKASDLSAFGLQSPTAEISVTANDNKTQRLLVGDETPTGGSFYAKLDGDPRVFAIFSGAKTGVDKTAKDLRDKRLLTFDSEKLTRVSLSKKGETIEFGKNAGNEWQILKPKPLRADGGQVEELIRKLKDARMDTAVSDEESKKAAGAFASGTLVGSAVVTDNSGTQTLQVRKKGGDYYAQSTALDGVYKVTSELGEGISKDLNDFRTKKLFDFGFSEPSKIDVRDGTKTYSFVKSGEKWTLAGKQMDAVSVQALIDKLRDLSATKFVESGYTTPVLDITVTSNDGKRVETVNIAKSGSRDLAKRGNEPALYELDSKAVEEIQRSAADVKEPPPPPAKK